ncbi:MAG: hypothetical protein A2836_01665 [Candidatus Taylorbacteria bacterium RIFCSPHIGHO2_01_FULL_45_63]|uniref:EfeO-type cupredoxin-like domain-containing protein n=1 Tax=Candidatus Taylorbacteria bacterium RIFCSPHIGHO2_02_FULL_45_35 TaxID=1802311 RepID=A0A1G2MS19_9BACT|nr:MAG: hypothetical protein A2836_01665 [Candidatus Taylorbacteria bacterium RIFCSPHIGHO2_01_FULL_45_63]OHA26666.1 MAG: hypothetical protein A3D56_02570 [Candidatus Taylorbacteria bacterium RIFCSPHIGHO2_02_FULL_45_35]OHA32580.1 MAG: hypothetical protein A3A22_01880 [Candidatus Taylorbacteria bacterium RIFCSPLOWO2_01_FULL_45_34b]
MKNAITALIVIIAVVLGIWFLVSRSNPVSAPAPEGEPLFSPVATTTSATSTPSEAAASTTASIPNIKEITVTGKSFAFSPAIITVKKGDTVKVTFKNSGGTHDFVIDEFGVRTKRIQGGAEETVEFTTNKTGQFEYYCSVGEHRAMGMRGTLIVE